MKYNIVQFAWGLKMGGMEQVIVTLAREFHRMNHNSMICTTRSNGELVESVRNSGIDYHHFGFDSGIRPSYFSAVMNYLKKTGANVVITHNFYGNLIPRLSARFLNIPAIIHVEHNVSDHKKRSQILVNRILSNFTDRIICVSERARESLIRVEKTNPDKIVVILNGLDTSRFSQQAEPHSRNGKIKVGIVASFTNQKGHIFFVEAASKIINSMENVEFYYIGDGPLRKQIEKKVRDHGLDRFSYFLGVRQDIGNWLQQLDVFVLSSLWEGLPISLLEAQFFGIPSVVTGVGGNPEVIKDGFNGLIVPPRNPSLLADAVLKVIRDDSLRSRLRLNAKKVFDDNFSSSRMAGNYMITISQIINRN